MSNRKYAEDLVEVLIERGYEITEDGAAMAIEHINDFDYEIEEWVDTVLANSTQDELDDMEIYPM